MTDREIADRKSLLNLQARVVELERRVEELEKQTERIRQLTADEQAGQRAIA